MNDEYPDFFIYITEEGKKILNGNSEDRIEKTDLKFDDPTDYYCVIETITKEEVKRLSSDVKKMLLNNLGYSHHHFGYGLYIRNRYIHGVFPDYRKMNNYPLPFYDADHISHDIFDLIVATLLQIHICTQSVASCYRFLYTEGGFNVYSFYFALGTDHTDTLSLPGTADNISGRLCKIRI